MNDDETLNLSFINNFETAWQSSPPPRLQDYLPDADRDGYLGTLQELVIIDLEFRWKRHSAAESGTVVSPDLVESYVGRFPILGDEPYLRRLVEEEFMIRHRFGDRPNPGQFSARFPQYAELIKDLANQLPAVASPQSSDATLPIRGEPVIENYSLIKEIGEGGMGSVYLARQEHPIRRKVAVKVIRSGLDSKEVIARFEAERQALAMMDHQNIARVFDAGATLQGQPFFAMEFVDGVPITQYCQAKQTSIPERLRLFNDVCAAVQHAHQKGILHRDLKPSNVLIAEEDGQPIAKVIDFGLAKAVDSTEMLTDKTLHTQVGQVLGTLKYMSPEQASIHESDIDTRADVYALGVMLYELLTGGTPLDESAIRNQGILKILELIRDHEPIRPSARLSEDDSQSEIASTERSITSRALHQLLAGDLDWIVMKALEKERERRYDSVSSLADDVRRFLNDEPVTARPPSASYRLQKFARKNRGLLTAVVISAVALIAATAISIGFAFHANQQRTIAEAAKHAAQNAKVETQIALDEATAAKAKADRSLVESEESRIKAVTIADFMEEILGFADPRSGGRHLTVAAALDTAVSGIDRVYADYPGIKSVLLLSAARTFGSMGQPDRAIELCKQAIEVQNEVGDQTDGIDVSADIYSAKSILANLYFKSGSRTRAIALQSEVIDGLRERDGEEHKSTIAAMVNLLGYLDLTGDLASAQSKAEAALALSRKVNGETDETTLHAIRDLGKIHIARGKPKLAVELHEAMIALLLSEDRAVDRFWEMRFLGESYMEASQTDKGIETLRAALVGTRKFLGPNHFHALQAQASLSRYFDKMGDPESATSLAEEELRLTQSNLGFSHPLTIQARHNLATRLTHAGQVQKAAEMRLETYQLLTQSFGEGGQETLEATNLLVNSLLHASRIEDALRFGEQSFRKHQAVLGHDDPGTLQAVEQLAIAQRQANRPDLAVSLLRDSFLSVLNLRDPNDPILWESAEKLSKAYADAARAGVSVEFDKTAVELIEEKLPVDQRGAITAKFQLAIAYSNAGDIKRSVDLHTKVLNQRREHLGEDHADTLLSMGFLGMALMEADDLEKALPICRETLQKMRKQEGPCTQRSSGASIALQSVYRRLGRPAEAIKVGNETLSLLRDELSEEHPFVMTAKYWLAVCMTEAGQHDQALSLHRDVLRDRRKVWGDLVPVTMDSMDAVASAFRVLHEDASVISTLETLLDAQRQAYGEDHAKTIETIGTLAYFYENSDRFKKAAENYATYAKHLKRSSDLNDFYGYLVSLGRQCYCLMRLNKDDAAEALLATMDARMRWSPESYLKHESSSLRGELKTRKKEFDVAEKLLISGYEGLLKNRDAIPDLHSFIIPDAIKRLIALYVAWEKPEQAARWRKELDTVLDLSSADPGTTERTAADTPEVIETE